MKQVKQLLLRPIKAFIVRTVIEDYNLNGETRSTLASDEFRGAALFGSAAASVKLPGHVRAGTAFPVANSTVTDTP